MCIEVGSFVSPQAVPQMAGTDRILSILKQKGDLTPYMALVPNKQGLEDVLNSHVPKIAIFASASQAFSQKNS